MAKLALTFVDVIVMFFLSILAFHELLAFQVGISPYLPNIGQLVGFDAVKVCVMGLCVWGVLYFMKRIRTRFRST